MVDVQNSQFLTTERDYALGSAYCSDWQSGQCQVRFSAFQPWGSYAVLATDYETYSVVYSCTPVLAGMISLDYVWILTRQNYEPGTVEYENIINTTHSIIQEKVPKFDLNTLLTTPQGNWSGCDVTANSGYGECVPM